jgi:hypothetical protein
MLILFRDQQASLLKSVDQGRVKPRPAHRLNQLVLHLLQWWGIEEDKVIRAGVAAEALPVLLLLLLEDGLGLR